MGECLENIHKKICCVDEPLFPDPYEFSFRGATGSPEAGQFQTNFVKTAKYTALTFLPHALILQFKRLANVYFLVIAILQSIPQISPLDPFVAWTPLIGVIAISMFREGYEDYQRYKSDKQTNYTIMTEVFRDGKFVERNWSEVQVGDIVRTYAQDMFPADLILLSSSNEGIAFIETASLDGEKNLKPRNAFKETIPYNSEFKIQNIEGYFYGIPPDEELHKFSSKIELKSGEVLTIEGDKQLLYRGTRLKNTKWIYGLAIYTGRNSKIIMNSKSAAEKMSQIEKKVNYILVLILIAQLVLCIVCAVGYGLIRQEEDPRSHYIQWPSQYGVPLSSFLIFLGYFVLLNTMIPISLIVSIEIVKTAQKIFINSDKLMYSEYRKKYVQVNSSSLNEELGQIEYVFSDKTGTLTMNIMEFKIAVIGNQMFGDLAAITGGASKERNFNDQKLRRLVRDGLADRDIHPSVIVKDKEGETQLQFESLRQLADEYLKALSMAHEVVADKDKKGNKIYQGPSPDEITLVEAAKSMEYQFIKATQSQTVVSIHGEKNTYELLEVFPFTSDRKRMSVVIREFDPDTQSKIIKMYTKGADSIIKKRLAHDQDLNLDDQLTKFSIVGLRTLLVGMRIISEAEYETFRNNVQNLPPQNKEKSYEKLVSDLESNIYLIGATAVLDRLQDDVPETIRDLIRANIKVWMLTGDKMQTAENIAKSCNLIQQNFEVFKYSPDPEPTEEQIRQKLQTMVKEVERVSQEGSPKALLVEGGDLTGILKSEDCRKQLANLAKECEAVVCCRLLPSQKAEVVKVVRQHLNKITLAIGDGANDVPMIKEAHIGVGLFGEEGMGAVQASDYALPEFRMLWRLLLVHGRWNYIRISEMILYFFYKNMLFTIPQFLTAFYCGFSSQTIFDDWYVTLYNLAFTSIPLIIRAVLEQDVNYVYKVDGTSKESQLEEVNPGSIKSLIKQQSYLPQLYRTNKYFYRLFPKIYFIGQENCIFNIKNYLFWMLEAIVESIVITIFTFQVIGEVSVNHSGINSDFWLVSLTIFSSVIMVVTFKLATHTRFWSGLLIFSILITSLGFYILHMWLTNFTMTDYVQGTTFVAYTSFEHYAVVIFSVVMVLFVDGIVVFMDFNRGGYASKMREIINMEKINNRKYYDALSVTITDNLTAAEQNHL